VQISRGALKGGGSTSVKEEEGRGGERRRSDERRNRSRISVLTPDSERHTERIGDVPI